MNQGFDYYRIKMTWVSENESGTFDKCKTEDLVYASSYTEAEKIAYALIDDQQRDQHGEVTYEIVKTKISELLYNDNLVHNNILVGGLTYHHIDSSADENVGLYGVKVMTITLDEKSAKEKRSYQTIYTPASSNIDAAQRVKKYLSMDDVVIRDAKFDKAESILWPTSTFQTIMNNTVS